MLGEGTAHRRRSLRSEGELAVAAVGELVHLLADDVGALSDPLEDADVLEGRGLQRPEAEPSRHLLVEVEEGQDPLGVGREDVGGADRRLERRGLARHQDGPFGFWTKVEW